MTFRRGPATALLSGRTRDLPSLPVTEELVHALGQFSPYDDVVLESPELDRLALALEERIGALTAAHAQRLGHTGPRSAWPSWVQEAVASALSEDDAAQPVLALARFVAAARADGEAVAWFGP